MARIVIIAEANPPLTRLVSELTQRRHNCSVISYKDALIENVIVNPPDLVLVEVLEQPTNPELQEFVEDINKDKLFPIITLISAGTMAVDSWCLRMDDFIVSPYSIDELDIRIRRILVRNDVSAAESLIQHGDLTIDLGKCEVTVMGELVKLTFKEYELLKFLALSKGHVYTREILLDKIWGYGFFGGDRTVDVHIRRLRSKIEDANHSYIETVRNVGYRFLIQ